MTSQALGSKCGEEKGIAGPNSDHLLDDFKDTVPVSGSNDESSEEVNAKTLNSNKKLIAESLLEHLVIHHEKDEIVQDPDKIALSDNSNNSCADEKPLNDELNTKEHSNDSTNATGVDKQKREEEPATSPQQEADVTTPAIAEVTMVKVGMQSYTKITSHGSAFTPTNISQENRSKRLKNDPHLQHLLPQFKVKCRGEGTQKTAPLLRSTSMPVCVESELSEDSDNGDKPTQREKGTFNHRTIYRTGSVSDYTRQKLKTSILMRTSASLVRKPSITEQEIRHLQADADSSLSDEDEEDLDEDCSTQFKPVTAMPEGTGKGTDASSTLSCGVESGAVDNMCRESGPVVTASPLVGSPLASTNVAQPIAITSA